jgi:hypothetical protein
MELHREMSEAIEDVPLPSEGDLGVMRAAVLRRVGSGRQAERARHAGQVGSSQPFWKRWAIKPAARPVYVVVFAVAFVALGFLLGRMGSGPLEFEDRLLVEEVVRQASLERGLDGYWDSPFIYSNVSMRRQNGGVMLSFDITRRVDVATNMDSPLSREVLVHAMIDPSHMGSRFEAMAAAGRSMDERMREAMVFILLNDPSLPVRLRSLDILSRHSSDPVVQDALLASLSQDPSVQVRLLALESLAREQVAPDVIRHAIGDAPDESGRAVLHRAIELVGES